MKHVVNFFWISVFAFSIFNCSTKDEKRFRSVPSKESGITFRNVLKETVEFNIFNYMYFYNGGGVAVGDLNGDQLLDIYFTANQDANKLYLNEGHFKFKDITEVAGVEGFKGWSTGVTMADVNDDGRLDIYVGFLGDYSIYKGKNQLFINEGNDSNGIPRFTDRAMEFGLDLVGFSTQAAFFDYDKDGDLDMFMLNHSLHENGTFGKSNLRYKSHPLAGDKLMRNDNGHFVDATAGSGIYDSVLGYGLGVAISDVNLDGWLDIYVGNDFHENDYLYLNLGNGTFKEVLEQSMNHTSRYTMGVDFADFNNDAFPDLIAMDMLSDDQIVLKSSVAEDSYDQYTFKLNYGYNHQYARNTLQLNNQDGTFSEIGLLAGVSATDWSWSSLFADFDLDGFKDIFISNGIMRRSNDLDYINFITVDSIQMKMRFDMSEKELLYIDKMPRIKIPNALYLNNHDSTFSNKAIDWGLNASSYSNGTAYGDFDNDGDLDLVINNIEDEALLYENRTVRKTEERETREKPDNHYLQIGLKGEKGNSFGIGTKIFLYSEGKVQMQECMPTRGFQSAVDYRLLFGTGKTGRIDSLIVVWSDDSFERIKNVNTDQLLLLDQQMASGKFNYASFHTSKPLFKDASDEITIPYKHKENKFVEFNREGLIPHMMSAEGPAYAVGDINGDGREDLFLGGAKWQPGYLFIQSTDGKFKETIQPVLKADSTYEDVAAVFFDADSDKDQDLFVVSGGNVFFGNSQYRKSRLYINDGRGNMSKSNSFPDIFNTGSCVSLNDIDKDGDLDMFLGSRTIPWRYGVKPDSYFLINDGKGNFKDATKETAPDLIKLGFVKKATWADMDGDQREDLILATDWNPILVFLNKGGKLTPLPLQGSGLENTNGWWNVIVPYDFDGDGDNDMIAGNLGLNSKLHASVNEPIRMYVSDFDKNDSTDQVLTHMVKGKEYPFHTRDEMTKQMPSLKKKYLFYHKFAEATLQDMFNLETLDKAQKYEAYNFATSYFENLGHGKFRMIPLPKSAQFAPVRAIGIDDFDGDKIPDVLLAGNFYYANIQMGRYDASYGLVLRGNGKGGFEEIPPVKSGLSLKGEVKGLQMIKIGNQTYYISIRNNDTLQIFTLVNN
jgi:hypothetical protein